MSPRSQEANQRIRDERREAILQAAVQVFSRLGLATAKISDIAAAAGVSYGLVYHYFGTKEAIFGALAEQASRSLIATAHWLPTLPGTPREQLSVLTTAMLAGLREQSGLFMIALEALTREGVPAAVRQTVLASSDQLRAALVAVVEAGQAGGELAPGDPEQLATLYLATVQGLALGLVAAGPAGLPFPTPEQVLRTFTADK